MKKKSVFIIIIVLAAVILLVTAFFLFNRPKPSSPDNIIQDEGAMVVGNDRDEHGCLGSAGYSWCEAKQKCLRSWEEKCDENASTDCGIENCHSLEITCGPKPAQICTEIYQLGDRCRQHAQCSFENGVCRQTENPSFTACKDCVNGCLEKYKDDQIKLFECESRCE